jgi:hypothetical protein
MKVILISEKRLEELIEATRDRLKVRALELERDRWPILRALFGETEIELHNLRRKITEESP